MIEQLVNNIQSELTQLLNCDKFKYSYIPYNGLYIAAGANPDCNWESDYFRFKLHISGLSDVAFKNSDKLIVHYVESGIRLINHNFGYIYQDLKVGNRQKKCTLAKLEEIIFNRALQICEAVDKHTDNLFNGVLPDKEIVNPNALTPNQRKLW